MSAQRPVSEVDICNLALDQLNVSAITSIDDPETDPEEVMSRWYHQIRLETLRKHPWNFASKRANLAQTDVEIPFGYENAYLLPDDFVRLIAIGSDGYDQPLELKYQLEDDHILIGSVLTEDSSALPVRYVYDFQNVAKFDPLFTGLFVIELALAVSQKFSASEAKVEQLRAQSKEKSPVAFSVDGQERKPTRITRSRLIARRKGRMGGSTRGYAGPYLVLP